MSPGARRAWWWFKRIAPWALAALVLTLVALQAHTVDWPAVWLALQAQSPGRLTVAAALALLSYGLYACFDLVGRRLTGHRLSAMRTLSIAAISYAFNLNLGAWIGGIGLRLRLYTRWGVSVPAVTQIVAHSMVTNWIGYLWIGGAVLIWAPQQFADTWWLPGAGLRVIGLGMVATVLAWLALCRFSRQRQLTWRGYTLTLANAPVAALQAMAGGANWLLIGAIVWGLLGGRIDYPTVLGVMLLAAVAGAVTHVPANLGVLEAVVLTSLGSRMPAPELLAAVLAYRAAYYLLPLVLALPAYALSEAAVRRTQCKTGAPEQQPRPGRVPSGAAVAAPHAGPM